jgi:DTW domain-containing protein YfiP
VRAGEPTHDHPAAAAHEAHTAAPAGRGALGELVSALLEDPAVRQRIEADPELRELWEDPAVRRQLEIAPQTLSALQRVMALTRDLVADPQVQAQIQEDPSLRELWSDPAVRQRILGTPHP